MTKEKNIKKDSNKKTPAHSLKEKRAAKKAKIESKKNN